MKLGSTSTTGWRATIAVAMSNYIEAGSIIAIATSLGFWQAELGFGDLTAGLLAAFSANAFGAAIGAMLGGPLSDKLGRKFIYTYDLVVFMVGILLAAFAVNVPMLFVGFILTGIAVGAGVPASWTYIAEQAPSKDRAKHVGTAQLAWSFGPLVGFALAALLAPLGLFGSRMIFIHLFIVAAIVWWVRQGLAESQLWKDQKANHATKDAAVSRTGRGFGALLSKRVNVTALLFLFGIYGFWGIVAGQAGIFMPRVYAAAGVESVVEQSLLQVLVWGCTVIATYFGFMQLADRMSRRLLYIIGAALGILGWIVLVFGEPGTGTLVTFAITWGLSCGIGAQAFYGLWASELFATRYRASAQGLLFFAARLAIGFLSYFFPVLLTSVGVSNVGLIMVGFLTVALLVGAIWAPRTQGKSLREIEDERYGTPVVASEGTAAR